MIIFTKYLSATDRKGARVKAVAHWWDGTKTTVKIPYDYAYDYPKAHAKAAEALAVKLGISANFKGCDTPKGMAFMSCDGANAFDTLHIGMENR